MPYSPIRHLYRRGAAAVICALLSLAAARPIWGQIARRTQVSKGPRATAILQLQGKRARIIPLVILVNGQFYDASIYRADPVPMALYSGVVYEAVRSGASVGLFTVGNALQVGKRWYGLGHWETDQQIQEAKQERAKEAAQAKAAQSVSAQAEDSGPPVLRRPGNEKTQAPAPPSPPPAQKPASKAPQQTAKAVPPPPPTPAPSSGPDEYDPNRPILRRGAPAAISKEEASWPSEEKPASTTGKAAPAKTGPAEPKIEEMAAISDAAGPELRSYSFSLKPEERDADSKKMMGYAQEAVSKYERARHTDFASAQMGEADFRFFDVDLSNEPVFVLSAPATVSFGAKRPRTTRPRPGSRSAQPNEPVSGRQGQAYVTVVGKIDLYGEVKLIFSSVTDSLHLDEIPRLQLIDAVDVDGDSRGELLFRETTDSGQGYIIYRVYPDQLMQLFDSRGPED